MLVRRLLYVNVKLVLLVFRGAFLSFGVPWRCRACDARV
jgi:hypothetical protein